MLPLPPSSYTGAVMAYCYAALWIVETYSTFLEIFKLLHPTLFIRQSIGVHSLIHLCSFTHSKMSLSKNIQPDQDIVTIFDTDLAFSNWPHFHSVYLAGSPYSLLETVWIVIHFPCSIHSFTKTNSRFWPRTTILILCY